MQGNTDRRKKKIAPIVVAILVILYIVPLIVLVVMAMAGLIRVEGTLLPVLLIAFYLIIGAAVVGGVLMALRQRLREIDGGEEEDARKY